MGVFHIRVGGLSIGGGDCSHTIGMKLVGLSNLNSTVMEVILHHLQRRALELQRA